MASSLQTLILLLSTIALLLAMATDARLPLIPRSSLKSRTSFAYDVDGWTGTGLTLQGDAHYVSGTRFLRLTAIDSSGNAMNLSPGRVLFSKPIPFWDKKTKTSFETTVKFLITPNQGDELLPADGLVFFITGVNSTVNAPGGSFGVFDESGKNPSLFAVEFDIFINENFDPSYRHVGIDIGSQISSNVTAIYDEVVGQEVTAYIKYDATTNLISVHGSVGGQSFEVSYVYDLSTILPQQVQVGISAATGGCVAVHDVMSWSFSSTMVRKKHF